MFDRRAEPIANVPVYRRIPINESRAPEPLETSWGMYGGMIEEAQRAAESARIWRLIVQTATGTNPPEVAPSEYQAPSEDCA